MINEPDIEMLKKNKLLYYFKSLTKDKTFDQQLRDIEQIKLKWKKEKVLDI